MSYAMFTATRRDTEVIWCQGNQRSDENVPGSRGYYLEILAPDLKTLGSISPPIATSWRLRNILPIIRVSRAAQGRAEIFAKVKVTKFNSDLPRDRARRAAPISF